MKGKESRDGTLAGRCRLRFFFGASAVLAGLLLVPGSAGRLPAEEPPNVLLITVDDLNDWIRLLDPDAPIRTPNLERLASRGVSFSRAYCVSPSCNPSRVAAFTGKRPSTTGVYENSSDWIGAMGEKVRTVFSHFREHGYRVEGTGKIYHHHAPGFHHTASFDAFRMLPFPPDRPMPARKLNGFPEYGSPNTDWGAFPENEADHVDGKTVADAIERLERLSVPGQPFFLAVGIFRPHMPFFAPASAFRDYPEDGLIMPEVRKNDLDDIPEGRFSLGSMHLWPGMMRAEAKRPGAYREAVRAYQVCATYADEMVGRLLDALERLELVENTVVILWSDHGYHLGEKEHWEKFNLWDKANHIPFLVAGPGVGERGAVCGQPVDMTVLFPTLCELAGVPAPGDLDGYSVVPFLREASMRGEQPAVSTYRRGNHTVRSERYRYIRYANGDEELYDHEVDPHEWDNLLAREGDHSGVIDRLARWLPQREADAVAPLRRKR